MAGAGLLAGPRRAWAQSAGRDLAAEFVAPWGVAWDGSGALYVADAGDYRVKVFSPDGEPAGVFGGPGAAAGRLNYPSGLCVAGEDVLVCDTNNGRIARFGCDGTFQRVFGGLGIATAKLAMPSGVCATARWIWVANTRGHVVQRYEPETGVMDRAFGSLGDDAAPLAIGALDFHWRLPTAVATDGVRVFVLDSKHARIVALDEEGAVLAEWRPVADGAGLSRPQAMTWHDGALYVADTGNRRLVKLDEAGRIAETVNDLPEIHGVAVRDGRVAVSLLADGAVRVWETS